MCDVEHAKRRTRKRRQLFRACTLLMVKSNEHVLCGPGFCAVVIRMGRTESPGSEEVCHRSRVHHARECHPVQRTMLLDSVRW
jgi:hypothetical protein